MTFLEKKLHLAVAILFAVVVSAMIAFGHNAFAPRAEGTVGNPYGADYAPIDTRCKMVSDHEEAWRHAWASAWFFTIPEWENRSPGFKRDFSDGVTVKMSYVWRPRARLHQRRHNQQ